MAATRWQGWPASGRTSGGTIERGGPLREWPGNPASDWDMGESAAGEPRPTYLILMRLTNRGRRVMLYAPQRILEISHEVEQHGCEVVAQYSLLGGWDFAIIVTAKDNLTVHAVVRDLRLRGDLRTYTLPAVALPVDDQRRESATGGDQPR
jgi:uncharacterized protein with GYD domain